LGSCRVAPIERRIPSFGLRFQGTSANHRHSWLVVSPRPNTAFRKSVQFSGKRFYYFPQIQKSQSTPSSKNHKANRILLRSTTKQSIEPLVTQMPSIIMPLFNTKQRHKDQFQLASSSSVFRFTFVGVGTNCSRLTKPSRG
jgi:hypothetical protein